MNKVLIFPVLFFCLLAWADLTGPKISDPPAKYILDKYLTETWDNEPSLDASGNRVARPSIHYWLKTTKGDKEVGKGEWGSIILR